MGQWGTFSPGLYLLNVKFGWKSLPDVYSFSPRNSTSFFLSPILENVNSIHQVLKKEAWVTRMTLSLLSRLSFHDCELYPSASEISKEPTSFHIHFPFPHKATVIPHLYYSNTFLLSPGLTPFYLVRKKLQSSCFEKEIWLHDSLLSNISINPVTLKKNNTIPLTLSTHTASLCKYLYTTISEKAMAPHSSALAGKIPWTEEPGGLQSMGSRRVRHDWATSLSLFTFMHWRRKWQPTPVFLPGESQGRGSLVDCRLWGRTELDTTEAP